MIEDDAIVKMTYRDKEYYRCLDGWYDDEEDKLKDCGMELLLKIWLDGCEITGCEVKTFV